MKLHKLLLVGGLMALSSLSTPFLFAQEVTSLIQAHLDVYSRQQGFSAQDLQEWEITDQSVSRLSGVKHVYIRQTYQGIPVFQGVANFSIRNGEVRYMADRLEKNLATRANLTEPVLDPLSGIQAAASALGLASAGDLTMLESDQGKTFLFDKGQLSREDIPVKLVFQPMPEDELRLAWDITIHPLKGDHWWSVRVDAENGKLLDQIDWVLSCNFVDHPYSFHGHSEAGGHNHAHAHATTQTLTGGEQYRVYPISVESPNHGPRALLVEPNDSLASPFAWHDTDGALGAEFTITRGNNVWAAEDRNNNNTPGYSPDGGASLNFDFPLDLTLDPINYQDAAITNLFYYNNMMHDVWYHYGFDEVSGNFQANNYGRGGIGGDFVFAEAQDGGGLNNATFGTPPEGANPQMQMFLWQTGPAPLAPLLTVNTPNTIAGPYIAAEAGFGPGVPSPALTGDLVLAQDGAAPINDICSAVTNAAQVAGKIALIDRGNCTFVTKVQAAQDAGAIAVIVANNQPGNPFNMGGATGNITIPSVMISQSDGVLLKNALAAGDSISVTIGGVNAPSNLRDGDFDNGIIAHEYAHGISNRLTNGPNSVGCLFNAESMGEGWSDWYGLMMDFDPTRRDRGIGTFASDEPITGGGIRPARYSPDFNVNPFTYDDVNNAAGISQPHGIGFIWATMLWDLTLVMVDSFGYDPDIINGTGGNNMVMALVTEGLKLQPCSPGFVDGRDAILQADIDLYGGVHQCLIWEVFARRGLGFSASQGSSASRSDQVEAFDLPTSCQTPTAAPVSLWSFTAGQGCGDKVFFNDESTDIPQSYFWDFGDGSTDSIANPVHTYNANGIYLITHIVTNTIGSDTSYKVVTISLPPGPVINDQEICLDNGVTLLAPVDSGLYIWYDVDGNVLDTAANLSFLNLAADTMVMVQGIIEAPVQQVGPLTGASVGGGGYHNTNFTGTVNFEAFSGFTLISVWTDAGSSGPRTINLWDGPNASGQIIDQVTVNIPQGAGRVNLGLEIPQAGTYSVGGTTIDLFRNNNGANYPYDIAGLVSLNGSSAGPDFYYYLYDWEVQEEDCRTDQVPAEIRVKSAEFSSVQDSFTSTFTFTDLSVGASDWLWDFGDSTTSTAQSPIHTYASPGTYLVTLIVDGLCVFSDSVEAVRLTGIENLPLGVKVSLTPNPTKSSTQISFSEAIKEPVSVTVLSMKGQVISEMIIPAGVSKQVLPLQGYSPGVYLLELRNERNVESLRLVVQP